MPIADVRHGAKGKQGNSNGRHERAKIRPGGARNETARNATFEQHGKYHLYSNGRESMLLRRFEVMANKA